MRRLKTVRRPPSTPRPQAISPVAPSPTPFRCPHAVHPCPSVDSGLEDVETAKAASILEAVETDKAAEIIEELGTTKAAEVLEQVETSKAADILEEVETSKAAEIIEEVETSKAAEIIEEVETSKAADILEEVETTKASDILSEVEPEIAGQILDELSTAKVTDIVQIMDEDELVERLPEMSIEQFDAIPDDVLFDELPGVPAEQLADQLPPEVDPSLAGATLVRTTDTGAIYALAETGELVWVAIVGSPAPIDQVLTKFSRSLTDIEVTVEDLTVRPAGSPEFAPELKVNSLFSIDVSKAGSDDFVAAHVTLFIEKRWIEANDVHKWSIQLQRLDEEANQWVPF